MDVGSVELRCPRCTSVRISSDLGAAYWNCRCGSSYYLRRCAECPGYQIVRVYGDVLGLTVRAFSSFGVRLQTVALGEAPGLANRLLGSYDQARARMWEEACARGANAVVGVRLGSTEVGEGITEVIAHGTAVTVEPAGRLSDEHA